MQTKPNKVIAVLCLRYINWENFCYNERFKDNVKELNKSNKTLLTKDNIQYRGFIEPDSIKGHLIDDYIIRTDGEPWTPKFDELLNNAKYRKSVGVIR